MVARTHAACGPCMPARSCVGEEGGRTGGRLAGRSENTRTYAPAGRWPGCFKRGASEFLTEWTTSSCVLSKKTTFRMDCQKYCGGRFPTRVTCHHGQRRHVSRQNLPRARNEKRSLVGLAATVKGGTLTWCLPPPAEAARPATSRQTLADSIDALRHGAL